MNQGQEYWEPLFSYFTCVEESSGLKVGAEAVQHSEWFFSQCVCYYLFAKAYTVSCPAGLHYNPSIEKCDWPENTECTSKQNGQCHRWTLQCLCNLYKIKEWCNICIFSSGDGDVPQVAPILVEVAEDFDCATEGVFQDPDDCSRWWSRQRQRQSHPHRAEAGADKKRDWNFHGTRSNFVLQILCLQRHSKFVLQILCSHFLLQILCLQHQGGQLQPRFSGTRVVYNPLDNIVGF